jgi:hypothetical protein
MRLEKKRMTLDQKIWKNIQFQKLTAKGKKDKVNEWKHF